ncbi:MAG TPA: glycosyl transferase family 1, partial [Thermoleophilia bacterium]|nr:glycosyl transferase family 1 [Thermoleophilia bacterium]
MTRAVAYFGTYDPDYPRSAVVIAGLRELGVTVYEVRAPLPRLTAVEMTTPRGAARLAAALAEAHVALLAQLRGRVPADALIVGYPGHFLVPLGRVVAALLHARLVFDPLVSLADTFAGDRGLVVEGGWKERVVRAVDRAAFTLPDLVLADTWAHAAYYRSVFRLPSRRLAVVPVGALPVPAADGSARRLQAGEPLRVFQYGKWSPLHGAETVVEAAHLLRNEPFRFVLAGEGQLSA